jgi:hypothetical protein
MGRTVSSIALVMSLVPLSTFAWRPPDGKPFEELMLLTDDKLEVEAFSACIHSDTKYVARVMTVARKKHEGQVPWWVTEYQAVASTGSPKGCVEITEKHHEERVKTRKPRNPKYE